MNWTKKLFSLALSGTLAFSGLNAALPVLAAEQDRIAVDSDENLTIYSDLSEIKDYLDSFKAQTSLSNDGLTLTLLSDVTIPGNASDTSGLFFCGQEGKTYTLDLNGHKITTSQQRFLALKGNTDFTFVIKDTAGNGEIESIYPLSQESFYTLLQTGRPEDEKTGTLILESGTFVSNCYVANAFGKGELVVNGGTLICNGGEDVCVIAAGNEGKVLINGGTSTALKGACGMWVSQQATAVMSGGTIQGEDGIGLYFEDYNRPGFTMTGGEIIGNLTGIFASQGTIELSGSAHITAPFPLHFQYESQSEKGPFVTIKDGLYEASQGVCLEYQIAENYSGKKDSYIQLEGGEFVSAQPDIDSVYVESTQEEISAPVLVTGGSYSYQVDPNYVGTNSDPDAAETDLVRNLSNEKAIWQYYTDYAKIDRALMSSALNVMIPQEYIGKGELDLMLDSNTPNGSEEVIGLEGDSQYLLTGLCPGAIINLPDLELSGYSFEGWFEQAQGGKEIDPFYIVPSAAAKSSVIYAHWSADPDTPVSIPTSGKGIDEAGSQTVANVSGSSSTIYHMQLDGTRTKSVVHNTNLQSVVKSSITLQGFNEKNGSANPCQISFGTTAAGANLAVAGNEPLESAIPISITFPFDEGAGFISIPLLEGTAMTSTVPMIMKNGKLSPIPLSYVNNNQLIFALFYDREVYIAANTKIFRDVTSALPAYGREAIAYISSRGVMNGVGNGEYFDPYGLLSRAQIATMLYRFVSEPVLSGNDYPADVKPGLWYSEAAAWCYQNGLMAQGSNFNAAKPVTRQELAAIFYRLGQSHISNVNTALLDAYSDGNQVSPWAKEAMAWAVESKLIGQGSNLNPLAYSNRMNSAAIIYRNVKQG